MNASCGISAQVNDEMVACLLASDHDGDHYGYIVRVAQGSAERPWESVAVRAPHSAVAVAGVRFGGEVIEVDMFDEPLEQWTVPLVP